MTKDPDRRSQTATDLLIYLQLLNQRIQSEEVVLEERPAEKSIKPTEVNSKTNIQHAGAINHRRLSLRQLLVIGVTAAVCVEFDPLVNGFRSASCRRSASPREPVQVPGERTSGDKRAGTLDRFSDFSNEAVASESWYFGAISDWWLSILQSQPVNVDPLCYGITMATLEAALQQFDATEANLEKLEKLWNRIEALLGNGVGGLIA